MNVSRHTVAEFATPCWLAAADRNSEAWEKARYKMEHLGAILYVRHFLKKKFIANGIFSSDV
jgi:hypothetical protein